MSKYLMVLLVLMCGCSREYPAETRAEFLKGCMGNLSKVTCECALKGIEKTYSFEEFKALDEARANGADVPKDIEKIVSACKDKYGG